MNERSHRRNLFLIWQKMKAHKPLPDDEQLIGKIMSEHPEFHNTWEFADVLNDVDYDLQSEVNPYFHVTIHSMVERQLAQNEPNEVRELYEALLSRRMKRHTIIHRLGDILFTEIYHCLKAKRPFNNRRYIQKLKRLISNVRKDHHA